MIAVDVLNMIALDDLVFITNGTFPFVTVNICVMVVPDPFPAIVLVSDIDIFFAVGKDLLLSLQVFKTDFVKTVFPPFEESLLMAIFVFSSGSS